MGRLTLYQAVSLVVILHFMTDFSIESPPVKGYICGSVDVSILDPKEKVLRRPRRLRGTDGDGVSNSDVIYTHVLNRGPHGVMSPADAI